MKLNILRHKPNSPAKLPGPVFEYMQHRFIFLPEYLDSLRCFTCRVTFDGKDTTHVRIFSTRKAKLAGLAIATSADLDLHAEMLLFEGYFGSHGVVYIVDRRMPATNVIAPTSGRKKDEI